MFIKPTNVFFLMNKTIDVLPKTYKKDLINFVAGEKWKPIGFFALYGRFAQVNGVLCQVTDNGSTFPIQYEGENIFYCAVCDHPILNHYTVKNEKGRIVNIGSECIKNIVNPKIAELILNYVSSIESKAKRENRRLPKNKQLERFIIDNLNELNELRNKRVDKELSENKELFWHDKYYINPVTKEKTIIPYEWQIEEWKNKNAFKYKKGTFPNNDQIRELVRQEGKEKREFRERNQYNYLAQNLVNKNWNPETMKNVLEGELCQDGFKVQKIKWDKMDESFLIEEKELITKSVNEYLEDLQKRI